MSKSPDPTIEYRIIARDKDAPGSEYEDLIFDSRNELLREFAVAASASPPYEELRMEQREVGPWRPADEAMQAAPRRVSQTREDRSKEPS
jgi:hypothetical protein